MEEDPSPMFVIVRHWLAVCSLWPTEVRNAQLEKINCLSRPAFFLPSANLAPSRSTRCEVFQSPPLGVSFLYST